MPSERAAAFAMGKTMKTAVFYGGRDIRIEQVAVPVPGPGEVLVEVCAAGICGSDLHRYRGHDPWGSIAVGPYRTGHELAGVVVALGPDIEGVTVGQRVGVEPTQLAGCGTCRLCRRGDYNLCPHKPRPGGRRRASAGFSELDLALAGNVFPLPDHLSFAIASLVDVYACAVHAVHRASVAEANAIAVLGTGPVGLAVGQVARALGARQVLMIGRREEPLALARQVGAADLCIDLSRTAGLGEAVRELTCGEGADLVFETVGGQGVTVRQAVAAAGRGGAVVILGAFTGDVAVSYREANEKEITLRWSTGYSSWRREREYGMALDLVAEGRLQAAPLITHHFPLDRIGEAFAVADDKKRSGASKVVVEPSSFR
jgi:threonine dehydrogenase-like Zn-dependent dehydrogenase